MNSEEKPVQPSPYRAMSKRKDPSPWWRKLFSSNWWWYGEVNPDPATLPPIEKRPKYWRPHMWIVVAFWVYGLGAPWFSSLHNYYIPTFNDLDTHVGVAVSVNKKSPHIVLSLDDRTHIEAEFPWLISYFGGSSAGPFFGKNERKALLDCKTVQIKGTFIRYVPFERFRIWSLNCVDGSFSLSYDQIRSDWEKRRQARLILDTALTWGGLFLFLIAYFIRERKEYGQRI